MAIEDGAVVANLFLHLLSDNQIPSFLSAFHELLYEWVHQEHLPQKLYYII
jgi:hypothetical protein